MACTEERFEALKAQLWDFMRADIYPNEKLFLQQSHEIGARSNEWTHPPILIELIQKAKAAGLWNMFLPIDSAKLAGQRYVDMTYGLTNRQYAEVCEILGTAAPMEFAAQATNTTSPDTGNMEVLARYGSPAQREQWLVPLLEGKIRSCFAMTEPDVASSDATNIGIEIARDEARQEYVINGKKWWITGAGSLHCKIMILMGKTDPKAHMYNQQSQILVPMDTPGITLVRPMMAFGDDDAPKGHMEILFENCRVPFSNVLLGEGRGFEISQGRLGPGRIHHCMRLLGQAERALSLMCKRAQERKGFGKKFTKFDTVIQDIAKSRCDIECCRLLLFQAADLMDKNGNADPHTRQLLSLVKAHIPMTVQTIVDRSMQVHGAMGFCQDTPLFMAFCGARWLRMADGPDEVHWRTAARIELQKQEDNPLYEIGHYPVDKSQVFRKSTDPVSPETAKIVDMVSRL